MKRHLIVLVLFFVTIGIVVWFWPERSTAPDSNTETGKLQSRVVAATTPILSPRRSSDEPKAQLPGEAYEARDSRWKWWNEMKRKDSRFEWRMPISFYGEVLDEQDKPVAGAIIKLTWTDLSSTGSSSVEVVSDESGRFALAGKQGKRLVVNNVSKNGYYLSVSKNRFSYEYAAFFEENYHRPDPDSPVIFRMRKGSEAEPLMHRHDEIAVGVGRVGVIQLDPQTAVQVELFANGNPSAKDWSARISVPGGGIQVSTEEFPFTAPENDYQSSVTLDSQTPKPGNWTQMYSGGQFYVKTSNGQYGRIELKTISGKTFMRYSYFLNPSGSRNLEYDPAKKVP